MTQRYHGKGPLTDFITKMVTPKNTTKKRSRKLQCSPMVAGRAVNKDSCYTGKILFQIRDAYERTHPSEPPIRGSPPAVFKQLKTRLDKVCDKEDCWLTLLPKNQREYLDRYIFAPDQPTEWKDNPHEWLSNYDIIHVLKQYEIAYPEFEVLGPSSIDFDTRIPKKSTPSATQCVEERLCHFELADHIQRGKTKIGISINLDKHDGPGTHWVSLFVDVPNHIIFYFDSEGGAVPREIQTLVQRVMDQAKVLNLGIRFDHNDLEHQYGNSECGMYSLFFIITMLTGRWGGVGKKMSMKQRIRCFKERRISDKTVAEFRDRYFNPQ